MSIPVICDRCRVAGTAGTGDFSNFGDLLEFEPVKVKQRVNGWDADAQRGFIALLATTGSKRKAAHALGRNAFGIDQLLKRSDAGSFRIAFERAMAVAKQNGAMKIATGVADAAARNAQLTPPSRLIGIVPDGAKEEPAVEEKLKVLESIYDKWMGKVEAERTARLSGDVVAADFYLRQITFLEVMLEMTSKAFGWDVQAVLSKLRRGDHHITAIVNTELSDWMDRSRRAWWAQEGEPERPAHPDVRFLEPRRDRDGAYATAIDQGHLGACTRPARGYDEAAWAALTPNEQSAAWQAQYSEDASAQAEWERRAFAEHSEKA